MPLLDHFRPPLSERRHWHSFHNAWATYLASALNRHLPAGYFAEPNVVYGVEIDVAAYDERGEPADAAYSPPPPAASVPFDPAEAVVEVTVFSKSGGPTLAGAVELVSPANKDRPAARDAFTAKCEAYLRAGLGLVVVDVVTERPGNFHDLLTARLGTGAAAWGEPLYAAAYRPVERGGRPVLDLWAERLAVGGTLPTLPLWLRGGLCVPVELEPTYERTCSEQRVTVGG